MNIGVYNITQLACTNAAVWIFDVSFMRRGFAGDFGKPHDRARNCGKKFRMYESGVVEMLKTILIAACIGHIVCGVTDCMLAYTPDGRFDMSKDAKDPERMKKLFSKMPLKQIELSMMIGVFALFAAGFGYIGLSRWAEQFSQTAGTIMYISGLFFIVPIAAHHVLCGAVEWFYIKLDRTEKALETVLDFFKKTAAAAIAYVGLLVFCVTLFVLVVTGRTGLPVWACVFNTLAFFIILAPTKLPAKGNIANALMFLCLAIAI